MPEDTEPTDDGAAKEETEPAPDQTDTGSTQAAEQDTSDDAGPDTEEAPNESAPEETVPEQSAVPEGEVEEELASYKVDSDGVPARVDIVRREEEYVPIYDVTRPRVDEATQALLSDVKEDMTAKVRLSTKEFVDPSELNKVKQKFRDTAKELLDEELPSLDDRAQRVVIGNMIHEMLGLGDIEVLLDDENLEEIVVNGASEPAWVYHKSHGWLKTSVTFRDDTQIRNMSSQIARRVGKQISNLHPLLDAHLPSGDRVNSTIFPISTQGNTLTIRKFARSPWTITDFIANGTVNKEVAALTWMAMQYEMNVIVSGGTGSGKTSLLTVLMPFIPPNHRILSIEDTREISLPKFLHWVPLTTRDPNPDGKGGVSMLDLLVNALRMRPDRIIVGEIRRERQAEVLFEAMHTGHSVYSTLHADTAEQTIRRLINPPINVPKTLIEAVDLNIVMFRDRKRNIRRALEVAEVTSEYHGRGDAEVEPNIVYRWRSSKDKIESYNPSRKIFRKLRMHAGLEQEEIEQSLQDRQRVLQWMVDEQINTVDSVGKLVAEFYEDDQRIIEAARNDADPADVLGMAEYSKEK